MLKFFSLCFLIFPLIACQQEAAKGNYDDTLTIQTLEGNSHPFNVELALTTQEQMTGLMNREKMPKNAGMLFFFGTEAERAFWMKNTLIPLDLIFIKSNGDILHIHKNAIPNDLTSMPSLGPAAGVLEINGGLSEKLNIQAGDKIIHSFFNQNNVQ
jgi:uncharacterized membrane protein (UPF0127 family)